MTPDMLTRRRAEVAGKLARAEAREARTRAEESTNRGLTRHNRGSATHTKTPASAGTDRGRGPTSKESSVISVPTNAAGAQP